MCKFSSIFVAVAVLPFAACDIVHPDPQRVSNELFLHAILNADSVRHPMSVKPVDAGINIPLTGVVVKIRKRVQGPAGYEWPLVAYWDSARAAAAGTLLSDIEPCRTFGPLWPRTFEDFPIGQYGMRLCLTPEAVLEPGETYKVEAFADGYDPAWGETRVVGGFEIEQATLTSSAGSYSLLAHWTTSEAAHRYLMSLRWINKGICIACTEPWAADARGPSYESDVPAHFVANAGDVPMLDMAAVDEHLYAYATTGHGGFMFDVQPVQNVRGGFGIVGSVRYRSRQIDVR